MKNKEYDLKKISLYGLSGLVRGMMKVVGEIREDTGESPMSDEQHQFYRLIYELTTEILEKYPLTEQSVIKAKALLALMDAYEIVREESVLQFALTEAECLLPLLKPSPQKCCLLSYCYYYVEEPECAREAKRIVDSWDSSCYDSEMQEAIRCYRELV